MGNSAKFLGIIVHRDILSSVSPNFVLDFDIQPPWIDIQDLNILNPISHVISKIVKYTGCCIWNKKLTVLPIKKEVILKCYIWK